MSDLAWVMCVVLLCKRVSGVCVCELNAYCVARVALDAPDFEVYINVRVAASLDHLIYLIIY